MFKGASRFKTCLSAMVILIAVFAFVGCAKKVSPVVGSEGIAGGDKSSASASVSQGDSGQGGSVQGDVNRGMDSDARSQDMASSDGSGSGDQGARANQGSTKSDNGMASSDGMSSSGGSLKSAMGMGGPAMEMGGPDPKFAKNVYFDFDKWTIRGDARDTLTENARWLVANTSAKIKIEGHGDARGTNEYNLALGERRARSTKRYLINLGVSPSRISFISYGEEKGVCGEKTEGCFQKNRRAHFVVN